MFKRSIATMLMGIFAGSQMELSTPINAGTGRVIKPIFSRGKSGKVSSKRSNAAQHQRDAKKRNNIRKHK